MVMRLTTLARSLKALSILKDADQRAGTLNGLPVAGLVPVRGALGPWQTYRSLGVQRADWL